MPALTAEQISALAQAGSSNTEIRAALGRDISPDEKNTIDRARVVWRLRRAQKKQSGPASASERKNKQRRSEHALARRACADPVRRARLEKDPPGWLRHYMPGAFPLPFSKGHREIINGAIRAAKTGTGVAVAAPRGEGKTTVLRGISVFLVVTKRVRFPVVAGWTHKAAAESFRLWLGLLHGSREFRADYPEMTQPFEESTHAARLKSMTWLDTGEECGADVRATERCIILPDCIGAIASASVQGDVKGLNVTLPSGEVLRPDLLLIDDAQDPKRAGNPMFVAQVVETLEKQWMCMAGPQSRVTTMVACTVAAIGDVSEHFLSRPDFKSIRVSRVTSWPVGWAENDKSAPIRRLWDEWHGELLDGMADGDGGVRGRKFYRENKAKLTEGMTVSWSQRLDRKRKDPDALYSAMFDYYRVGEAAFSTEYQNLPMKQGASVYDLAPALIMSRTDPARQAYQVPPWCVRIIIATDINHYGLHTVALGFGNDQSAAVLWYTRFDKLTVPENAPEQERRRIVFEMLVQHGQQIAALPFRPNIWVIDGGYEHETVQRFVTCARMGPPGVVARGHAATNYRPYGKNVIGQPREQCHETRWNLGPGLAWNADYWREISQRAWLGSLGAPGAVSLFAGHHREFAEQICREKLGEKLDGKMGMVWRWITIPGWHDYGDSMAMAYMGAAWTGIGTGGPGAQQQQRRAPARCKIEMVQM